MVDLSLHLHPDVLAVCLGLGGAYLYAVLRYGRLVHPQPGDRPVTAWQATSFAAALVLLWMAAGSPLHAAGEALFAAHTVEHLLYALVVPPLLLAGVPTWMGELVLARVPGAGVLRVLGRPVVAAVIFNGVLLAMHWPPAVELMLASAPAHALLHGLMLLAGLVLWLPVASPVPAIPRLSLPAQMFYLFLQTLLPTIPASFLTFADTPVYGVYAELPRLWGISAVDDVRVAGLVVKIGAGFLLWTVITVLFFRWSRREEASGRGAVPAPADGTSAGPRTTRRSNNA